MDWTLGFFFKREIISLGAMQEPRQEFELAARSGFRAPRERAPAHSGAGRFGG